MSLAPFPTELIDQILEELGSLYPKPNFTSPPHPNFIKTLKSAALVCRRWRGSAQRRIYKETHIHISSITELEEIKQLVNSNAIIGGYIKNLILDFGFAPDSRGGRHIRVTDLESIATLFPELHYLRIIYPNFNLDDWKDRPNLANLDALAMDFSPWMVGTTFITEMLSFATNISSLALYSDYRGWGVRLTDVFRNNGAQAVLPTLSSLKLTGYCLEWDFPSLKILSDDTLKQITQLELTGNHPPPDARLLHPWSPTLRSLSFTNELGHCSHTNFTNCHSLARVSLRGVNVLSPQSHFYQAVRVLPPSVTSLEFDSTLAGLERSLNEHKKNWARKHFKKLEVNIRGTVGGSKEKREEKIVATLARCRAICSELGVALSVTQGSSPFRFCS
ncbi:hypothetical protein MNV49_006353 [Pseudohyphozyma bogoriensis]|nr:hypothetical protein MNV49_006353 [Pseudohyphozyma bogoriensis]